MKIILSEDVKGLGRAGQEVDVAKGYARNYLLPRGLAREATAAATNEMAAARKRNAIHAARAQNDAEAQRERLDHQEITVVAKAGEGGRLFGSVTTQELAERIESQFGVSLDKRKLELEAPIKAVGRHPLHVRLHPGVDAHIEVIVQAEEN